MELIFTKNQEANNAADLYLYLLGNPRRTVYDIFLNTPTDKYNKEIYLQMQKLVILREYILKNLTNKGILNNNSDQSNIVEQKYEVLQKKTKFEESLAGGIKLRKQRFSEMAKREKMINNNLFKEYFEYSSPSNMYKNLDAITNIEKNKTKVNKIKDKLANLLVNIKNYPTNNAKKLKTEITW